MSIVPKETIEVIAQSVGIPSLGADVPAALAPDVEYRLREIMQVRTPMLSPTLPRIHLVLFDLSSDGCCLGETGLVTLVKCWCHLHLATMLTLPLIFIQEAIKCMRHAKRTVLTTDDVESALSLRNVEIIEAPLPKAPLDTAVVAHWLAIEGIQPAIPENPPIDAIVAPTENKRAEHGKDDGLPVDIKLPVKHVLSKELQMYFDKIAELTLSRSDTPLFKEALVSLAKDSGLHPLVPYFSYFIADEVTRSLSDLPVLFALMRVVQSLLRNPHIHIEPYLHQLMPSMITCIVAKRLGHRLSDNHWELRDFSANLVASVCRRFGHVYHNLQTRLTKTLIHAFLDPAKSLTQHYGAVQGISALGPSAVDPIPKEAWRVYGALLCAAGKCLYDRLKLFPGLLSPSTRRLLRSDKRVATSNPNKRKSSTDLSASQPPLKKMATDASMNSMAASSMAGNMQGTMDGFSTQLANPGMMQASSTSQMVENTAVAVRREQGSDLAQRVSTVLRQAWKEDQDAGHLLGSLYEVFGEAIFSFVQPPEISIFV
ncbi:hypothetical protein PR202_gb08769 [Eleusine coracana subsp. coracana]|uniref:TATA box binding protein associated factor (TAF) histone-like fold domain-containing protein n=1 Tax=Eleusine coracana subsp. coracana TaxID=191504 RepID=A0AAV5EFH5_ELECO|nr:hypothetical protein PR202_gb08769 [Eleusine coracana subsp. coracana]